MLALKGQRAAVKAPDHRTSNTKTRLLREA
jgi:hypothetical protein